MRDSAISTANFFWHGAPLGLFERVCIASFIRHGFTVQVFSYDGLSVPAGARLMDAREILPADHLYRYTQDGLPRNLPAFSDAFRYHLLAAGHGWWFDTDVLCLAPAASFAARVRSKKIPIALGYEDGEFINGAALYLQDEMVLAALMAELQARGTSFDWGAIGPKLLTAVIQRLGLEWAVDPPETFYPVYHSDIGQLERPADRERCLELTRGSLALHLWSEIRRRSGLSNTDLPPKGSYLHGQFVSICPELDSE
jgi:hypothetical protein